MDDLTPSQVRSRATAAHQPIAEVMRRAGVSWSTFWRWDHGHHANLHPVTARKISDALASIEAERAA